MNSGELDKNDQEQWLMLIAEVLDGTVDDDSREALNTLLKTNPDARKFYRGHMELHSRLHLDYTGGAAADAMPVSLPKPGTATGPGGSYFFKTTSRCRGRSSRGCLYHPDSYLRLVSAARRTTGDRGTSRSKNGIICHHQAGSCGPMGKRELVDL